MFRQDGKVIFHDTPDLDPYFQQGVFEFCAILSKDAMCKWVTTRKQNYGNVSYLNLPASFDIETSSFYDDNKEKVAIMYVWQFGINGTIIMGRTWEQYNYLIKMLHHFFDLNCKKRILIYVHNLGYEFQFMRGWFKWDEVFAPKKRRPLIALNGGVEYRCSYFLSNYSLANVGALVLQKYKVEKMVGDLDYSLVRTPITPLTSKEIGYCVNDVRVVMSYIQEKIEQEGDIIKIPLTNTGNVRRYVRARVFGDKSVDPKKIRRQYTDLMQALRIRSTEEYQQMKRAFQGGFTHASAQYSRKILKYDEVGEIGSMDLSSSYPYVCVSSYFPMSGVQEEYSCIKSMSFFRQLMAKYCCLFDVEVRGLKPKFEYENMLSESKCNIEGNYATNNGRVIWAEKLQTTMTELDFDTFEKFYSWDGLKILNLRTYRRGYLPKNLILAILDLYEAKTSLKGIEGKEVEYMVSKNMINSTFGMMVTNIVRAEECYTDEWIERKITEESTVSQLTGYNNDFNRFLFYGWGVYVTAHARHNLFSAILEFGEDYVYCDTDSLKGLNFSAHQKYIQDYNDNVFLSLFEMCDHYGIDFEKCQPKTKKGIKKLIGVWDIEDSYTMFKTIGAKRYIYEYASGPHKGELGLTCAGVNKKAALKYLLEKWDLSHEQVMFNFDYGLYLPPGQGGKMNVTYIDKPWAGFVKDFRGEEWYCEERSYVHMEEGSYYLTLTGEYMNFLKGLQHVEW